MNGYVDECGYAVLDPDAPFGFRVLNGCGVHVFEVTLDDSGGQHAAPLPGTAAIRVDLSRNGDNPFNYEFHGGFSKHEEPEGVTYRDLSNGPMIPGTTSAGLPGGGHGPAGLRRLPDRPPAFRIVPA